METILAIVILVIVYSGTYIVKLLFSGKEEDAEKSPLDEVFPNVEYVEFEESLPQEPEEKATTIVSVDKAPEKKRKRDGVQAPANDVRYTIDDTRRPGSEAPKEKRISFKDKSDAKRAVILSEILNNKYN